MTTATLPSPGLGTSQNTEPEQCATSVETAIDIGYRHIDTAQMYENEAAVGTGIERSGVPREEVFVATKIHPRNLAPEDVLETARVSVDRLGGDPVDLIYLHWPTGPYDPELTLPAFDELVDRGLTERIGLSNFTPELLTEARRILDSPVFAHQVEMHPLLPQTGLVEYARTHDHYLVAYAPLGRGSLLDVPEIEEVAERRDATPAQVCIAWLHAQENVVPIPKATGEAHLRENWEARKLDLTREDHDTIAGIEDRRRLFDPDAAPWNA